MGMCGGFIAGRVTSLSLFLFVCIGIVLGIACCAMSVIAERREKETEEEE